MTDATSQHEAERQPITDLNTPWTLHFEGDGTEDIAVIRDASGEDMAATRPFWQPEGDDPIPQTLAAALAMKAAPNLLRALVKCESKLKEYHDFALGVDLLLHEQDDGALAEIEAVLQETTTAINEATERPLEW